MLYIAVVLYIRPSLLHFYPFDLRTPRYPPPSLYGGMHYLSTCNDTRFRDVPGADVLGPTTHQEGMIVVRWGCLEPPTRLRPCARIGHGGECEGSRSGDDGCEGAVTSRSTRGTFTVYF